MPAPDAVQSIASGCAGVGNSERSAPSISLGVTTRPPSGTSQVPERGAMVRVPSVAWRTGAPPLSSGDADCCAAGGCITRLPVQAQPTCDACDSVKLRVYCNGTRPSCLLSFFVSALLPAEARGKSPEHVQLQQAGPGCSTQRTRCQRGLRHRQPSAHPDVQQQAAHRRGKPAAPAADRLAARKLSSQARLPNAAPCSEPTRCSALHKASSTT